MKSINLNGLTEKDCLVVAVESINALGWEINELALKNLTAAPNTITTDANTERIKIRIEDSTIYLKAEYNQDDAESPRQKNLHIEELINTILKLKSTFNEQELSAKYEAIKLDIPIDTDDTHPHIPKQHRLKNFLSIFKPTKDYFVTPILINLNIAIFVIMVMNGVNVFLPDNESLLIWGANFRPMTLSGEPWRLISSCFLHIGIIHLIMNMYALSYIGALLEPHLGRTRFLTVYLLTGVIASATSLAWNNLTISAGASGAIFGMYGVFLALLTTNIINEAVRKTLLTSILSFVGYNIVIGLSIGQGIDNAAHIGGLISGLALGYALVPSLRQPLQRGLKVRTIAVMVILVFSGATVVYKTISDDIVTYNNKMQEFSQMEATALGVYKLSQELPTEEILAQVEEKGISQWKKAITLIDSLDVLDLPESIVHKNKVLKEYCELRLSSYELLHKAVSESSNNYDGQLENYNKQIKAKIEDIQKLP